MWIFFGSKCVSRLPPSPFSICNRRIFSTGQPAWQTFLQIVETKEDLYVQHQANRILVQIVVNDGALLNATSQQGYFAWVTNTIQSKVCIPSPPW